MRRLARRLLTLCSSISLLLCVAVCVLWVRSFWRYDSVDINLRGRAVACSLTGSIQLSYCPRLHEGFLWHDLPGVDSRAVRHWDSAFNVGYNELALGFGYAAHRLSIFAPVPPYSYTNYVLVVPYWFATACTALLPAVWFRHWSRGRRSDHASLCPTCGYDLRATPGRCPECGTAAAAAKLR